MKISKDSDVILKIFPDGIAYQSWLETLDKYTITSEQIKEAMDQNFAIFVDPPNMTFYDFPLYGLIKIGNSEPYAPLGKYKALRLMQIPIKDENGEKIGNTFNFQSLQLYCPALLTYGNTAEDVARMYERLIWSCLTPLAMKHYGLKYPGDEA